MYVTTEILITGVMKDNTPKKFVIMIISLSNMKTPLTNSKFLTANESDVDLPYYLT